MPRKPGATEWTFLPPPEPQVVQPGASVATLAAAIDASIKSVTTTVKRP